MFYDLEEPREFMREVLDVLEDDGIWVFEQSYLPTMLETNGYDTVCHEHLEYYSLTQIKWMSRPAGAKIIDVEFNDVNGGSFSVTVARAGAPQPEMAGTAEAAGAREDAGLRRASRPTRRSPNALPRAGASCAPSSIRPDAKAP